MTSHAAALAEEAQRSHGRQAQGSPPAPGLLDGPRERAPAPAYRPDIDGLRAVAVLAVVLFHAFPGLLAGGFVGVDVFLVISGYLISGNILAGLGAGRFSLLDFYRRRIHRIFPALIAVLAACLLGGYLFLVSDEFSLLGKHTLYGALFSQNIALWHEQGYFAASADKEPLLHLWTLAIEEQFYIAYPLILLALWRGGVRLTMAIPLLCLLSFALNVYWVDRDPIGDFYFIGTRAWELLAGAILAVIERPGNAPPIAQQGQASSMKTILAWSGLALILAAVARFDSGMSYPGIRAAAPVLGTMLIIASGSGTFVARHLLGNRLMVGIGLISYPLYLWHWPLLSFRSIVEPDGEGITVNLALVLAAVALSVITYWALERRLRRRTTRPVTIVLIGAVALLAALGFLASAGEFRPRHAMGRFDQLVHRALQDWSFPGKLRPVPIGDRLCYAAGGHGPTTLFWGDSHIQHYAPRIYELVKDNRESGRGVVILAEAGVPPLPGVEARSGPERLAGNVARFRELAADPRVDTVVVGARWDHYLTPSAGLSFVEGGRSYPLDDRVGRELAFTALGTLLARLAQDGKTVYLIQDNPSAPQFQPTYIYRRGFLDGGFSMRAEGANEREQLALLGPGRDLVASIAAAHGLRIIDPLAFLVRGERFPSVTEQGEPIYIDDNHFRASFVIDQVRFLDRTVEGASP